MEEEEQVAPTSGDLDLSHLSEDQQSENFTESRNISGIPRSYKICGCDTVLKDDATVRV